MTIDELLERADDAPRERPPLRTISCERELLEILDSVVAGETIAAAFERKERALIQQLVARAARGAHAAAAAGRGARG